MTRLCIVLGLWFFVTCLAWARDPSDSLARKTRSNLPSPARGTAAMATFNQEDFALAYEVFLANADQERAYRVASAAVEQVPNDSAWRRKLARVADWTQRPEVSVLQWRWLFAQGDRSNETVGAVIRLSALMEDPTNALQAWAIWVERNPVTPAQWDMIFDLFESDDEPLKGSHFFEAQFLKKKQPQLLDLAARLAENAGADGRADQLYQQRMALAPFSMEVLLRAVMSLIRQDKLLPALALMNAQQAQVPKEASEFWQLLSQIAWDLREFELAKTAYSRLASSAQSTAADWTRLIYLLRQQHPDQAAGLAMEGYQRFGSIDLLLQALDIYANLGDLKSQERALAAIKKEHLLQAEGNLRLRMLRAVFYQKQKKPAQAWLDLRKALALAPDDRDVILSVLWFLIDEQRNEELLSALRHYAPQARLDTAYWSAYAAGYQTLDRPRPALRWFEKEAQRKDQDPLILLNYADLLERNQQIKRSVLVRRTAWKLLNQLSAQWTSNESLSGNDALLATARLALLNRPGDPAQQWIRQRLSQVRNQPASDRADTAFDELVLSWSILKEQFPNAQSWMWLRYARKNQSPAPAWASSQVALQLGDTKNMALLLDKSAKTLPIYNRYDTAYALGDTAQALDIAARGMEKNQTDAALHDRYRQHAPLQSSYIQAQIASISLQPLIQQSTELEGRWVLNPRLHLVLGWTGIQQSSTDPLIGPLAPNTDRLDRVETRWLHNRQESSFALFRRGSQNSLLGMRLRHAGSLGQRLGFDAGLDYRSPSTLSLPMRVAGYENSLSGGLNYVIGKREYLRISPRLTQYFTQFEDYLGSGRILDMEAGYRVRTEYPDWRLRAFAVHQNFSRDGGISENSKALLPDVIQQGLNDQSISAGYFIPEGNTSWGLCANLGENVGGQSLQTTYSRAWRPFLDLCYRRNTLSGDGYTRLLGYAGSITGEDHLSIQWQYSDVATPGSPAFRALQLRYRHYF
jgi:polysaccharide biosynthesis protein PelB